MGFGIRFGGNLVVGTGPMNALGRPAVIGLTIVLGLTILPAAVTPVAAQEPPPAPTLPLPVPDSADIQVELQYNLRGPGLMLTWPLPPDSISTMATLVATDPGLNFPISVDGVYGDDFDRTLRFQFLSSGTIGSTTRNRYVCIWANVNADRTGRLGGEINLSNTGGLWVRDGFGDWSQRNDGLPRYLPYTNLVDVAVASDGALLGILSSGAQTQNDPQGLFRAAPGGPWLPLAPETFGKVRALARVAAHPTDAARFAVGSRQSGLFVTTDGGATFTQWRSELDPDFPNPPGQPEVTAMHWGASRLLVAVRNFGIFVSEDAGASFTRLAGITVPGGSGNPQIPYVRGLTLDPGDGDRYLLGINNGGVYELRHDGQEWIWTARNGGLSPLPTVLSLDIDPLDGDILLLGTLSLGFWRSSDGGATWSESISDYLDMTVKPEVWSLHRHGSQQLALVGGFGLHVSTDGGQSWSVVADQPYNRLGRRLVSAGEDLLLATNGGGIFDPTADASFPISATISNVATDAPLQTLDLGLELTFGPGEVVLTETAPDGSPVPVRFDLICEDYQGWIVWRSTGGDPDDLTMIGRYDKNNPETCIEGFCGDDSYVQLPGCFSERRAACFDVNVPGQVSFWDEDIFNGFTYYYAITPFDYGDTSLLVDPLALNSPMIWPARFPDDPDADGPGNRFAYRVNVDATPALDGEDIYVYPNPLRLERGIAGGEGEQVVWTNLPPDSRIQVFTVSGERIAELPRAGEPQQGGNIYWITRNDDNRLLASGIYIWRVIMPQRGDYWGKLVIVR